MEHKHTHSVSPEQLQAIGTGFLAYVKPIDVAAASALVGQALPPPPSGQLFAVFNANGAPLAIAPTYEAAVGNAMANELVAARVH